MREGDATGDSDNTARGWAFDMRALALMLLLSRDSGDSTDDTNEAVG